MKKGFSLLQSGFTLIELLVVIGILGILTAGVLIAINPIEQINRASDTRAMNMVTQFGKAMHASGVQDENYFESTGAGTECYFQNAATFLKTNDMFPAVKTYTSCGAGAVIDGYTYHYVSLTDNGTLCTGSPNICSQFAVWVSNMRSNVYKDTPVYTYDSISGTGCARAVGNPYNASGVISCP